jgi:hypothetical protein
MLYGEEMVLMLLECKILFKIKKESQITHLNLHLMIGSKR